MTPEAAAVVVLLALSCVLGGLAAWVWTRIERRR